MRGSQATVPLLGVRTSSVRNLRNDVSYCNPIPYRDDISGGRCDTGSILVPSNQSPVVPYAHAALGPSHILRALQWIVLC
jgi:hypothetical protein